MPQEGPLTFTELDRYAQLVKLPDDAVLTKPDARIYWRVSPATWERLCATGQVPPPIRLSGRIRGWRKRDLDERMAALTEKLEEVAA
jgi:hypothetical protein